MPGELTRGSASGWRVWFEGGAWHWSAFADAHTASGFVRAEGDPERAAADARRAGQVAREELQRIRARQEERHG